MNLVGADRPVTGVERFARELAPHLVETEPPGWRVEFLATRRLAEAMAGAGPDFADRLVIVRIPPGSMARHSFHQLIVPIVVRRRRARILFSPMNVGTLAIRRQVVFVHDLAWQQFPQAYKRRYRLIHGILAWGYRRRRTTVACGTQDMRRRLNEVFPRNEIVVLPYGPGRERPDSYVRGPVQPDRLLWVGSQDPRKDLPLAVAAVEQASRELGRRLELVVAGRDPDTMTDGAAFPRPVHATVRRVEPDDHQLEDLYASSRLMLCTSTYEGYGFPVSEAVERRLPVVTSPVPAALELEGAGIRIVRTHTVDAFAQALIAELEGGEEKLAEAHGTSWEASARAVWCLMARLSAEKVPRSARGAAPG